MTSKRHHQTRELRVLQTNLNRMRAAHDMAFATAMDLDIDVLVVSEPNRKLIEGNRWCKDIRQDVAVLFRNQKTKIRGLDIGEGNVAIHFQSFVMYCVYCSPNISLDRFKQEIDDLMEKAKSHGKEFIIMGDLNVKSPQWGSKVSDPRGEYLTEWLAELDMTVINNGDKPTFVRGDTKSFIDVTCSTRKLSKKISKWNVLDQECISDHGFIYFEVAENIYRYNSNNTRKIACNWEVFSEIFSWNTEVGASTVSLEGLERIVKEAYWGACFSKERKDHRKPYWWNQDIENKRRECNASRRLVTRQKRKQGETMAITEIYKTVKKELQKLIRDSKQAHWDNLCKELETDMWGKGYQIAVKKLVGYASFDLELNKKKEIIRNLFPERRVVKTKRELVTKVDWFEKEELEKAARSLRSGKAPGIDGIPPEAIRKAVELAPEVILRLINELLVKQTFPNQWKEAKLVLIPKAKPEELKFRPICLLNSLSKLYETLLKDRLEKEVEATGGISESQFGFRKGRSTVHAVERVLELLQENTAARWWALITLDVRNAFNSIPHKKILEELNRRGVSGYLKNIIGSYLEDRSLQIEKELNMNVSIGVPQGSVLGPTLWNVVYDGVLRTEMPEGVWTVAFADDLAVVMVARSKHELVSKGDEALEAINNWMVDHGLELAPEKSEAIILKGQRNKDGVNFYCRGTEIIPARRIRYLGFLLTENRKFGEHIKEASLKAEKKVAALMRITPNIKGPANKKREMWYNVVQSIMMYGAPIWHDSLKVERCRQMMVRVQRKMLLRVASAFRTVSASAVQIITAIPPIDLMAKERTRLHKRQDGGTKQAKNEERETTIKLWQAKWENTTEVAQWTKHLIPKVEQWIKCKHRKTDYYLTQVLTGHGCFGTFTKRIGKSTDDNCMYCEKSDTVEHTLIECGRWQAVRSRLIMRLDKEMKSGQDMISQMVADRNTWEVVHGYIREIMKKKEEEEKQRK